MLEAFVDLSKAFNSVSHEVLWAVLEARGVHPKLSLIKDLYGGNLVWVAGHGVKSDWLPCPLGAGAGGYKVGHGSQLHQVEAVVFAQPSAAATATIQVGSNSVAGLIGRMHMSPTHEEAVLSKAGLEIPQGSTVCLPEGGVRFPSSCTVQRIRVPSQSCTEAQGGQLEANHNACLRQILGLYHGTAQPARPL